MAFDKKIVLIDDQSHNRDDLLKKMVLHLKDENCVKETFEDALLEREQMYPTGIDVGTIGIAIPHTDSVHVLKSQIAIAIPRESITFQDMTNKEQDIEVKIVFLIAMASPSDQVGTLQKLIELVQDENKVKDIITATSKESILKILEESGIN